MPMPRDVGLITDIYERYETTATDAKELVQAKTTRVLLRAMNMLRYSTLNVST